MDIAKHMSLKNKGIVLIVVIQHTLTVWFQIFLLFIELYGGVMVSVLSSNAVDRGFESQSGQFKDYSIGICFFSTKHAAIRRKSKDWFARNQNNVSEWSNMSTRGLLFQ